MENGEAQPSIRPVLRFIMMFMCVYKRERCDKNILGKKIKSIKRISNKKYDIIFSFNVHFHIECQCS